MILTTETLVSSVKRRTLAPTSQKTFQDQDIIALLNEELELKIIPLILSVREDYFLTSIRSPVVASVEGYQIPERAIGGALKDVWYLKDAAGTSVLNLPRLKLSDKADCSGLSGEPWGYIMQGDQVVLVPGPSNSVGYLEQWYLQRNNELVATTSCAKITGVTVGASTTVFDVDTDLTGSLSVGDLVDFLNAKSPTNLWAQDVSITAISTSQITVLTADIDDAGGNVHVLANDYVCPAKQANIPMVPQEFHPLLAEYGAARIVQALGHQDKLQAIMASISEMRAFAIKMISNRVSSDLQAIGSRRGISSYATGQAYGRGRWR